MGRDRSDRAAIWFGKRVAAYPLVALNRERVNVSLLMHPPVPLTHLGRSAAPDRPLRLLERMRNRLRTRRYSPRTERAYCDWVRRFVLYLQELLGHTDIRTTMAVRSPADAL